MRKKRCSFCLGINTKRHCIRTKRIKTSQGSKHSRYQYWYCKNCKRVFRPLKGELFNFSLKVKACELYYNAESSYRAVGRQLRIAPYRLFKIIDTLGANCKSTIDVAKELKPSWSQDTSLSMKRASG